MQEPGKVRRMTVADGNAKESCGTVSPDMQLGAAQSQEVVVADIVSPCVIGRRLQGRSVVGRMCVPCTRRMDTAVVPAVSEHNESDERPCGIRGTVERSVHGPYANSVLLEHFGFDSLGGMLPDRVMDWSEELQTLFKENDEGSDEVIQVIEGTEPVSTQPDELMVSNVQTQDVTWPPDAECDVTCQPSLSKRMTTNFREEDETCTLGCLGTEQVYHPTRPPDEKSWITGNVGTWQLYHPTRPPDHCVA